jgi:hypothetical protein
MKINIYPKTVDIPGFGHRFGLVSFNTSKYTGRSAVLWPGKTFSHNTHLPAYEYNTTS